MYTQTVGALLKTYKLMNLKEVLWSIIITQCNIVDCRKQNIKAEYQSTVSGCHFTFYHMPHPRKSPVIKFPSALRATMGLYRTAGVLLLQWKCFPHETNQECQYQGPAAAVQLVGISLDQLQSPQASQGRCGHISALRWREHERGIEITNAVHVCIDAPISLATLWSLSSERLMITTLSPCLASSRA